MYLHAETSPGGTVRIGVEAIPINVLAAFIIDEHKVAFEIGIQHSFPEEAVPVPVPIIRPIRPVRGPCDRVIALCGCCPEPSIVSGEGPPTVGHTVYDVLTSVFIIICFKRM